MRARLLSQHVEAGPARAALDRAETFRVVGAFVALLAAALLLLGGLLWREHSRAEARPAPPAAVGRLG